jgi:hypothetical protein
MTLIQNTYSGIPLEPKKSQSKRFLSQTGIYFPPRLAVVPPTLRLTVDVPARPVGRCEA